jgi:hypothetical protein
MLGKEFNLITVVQLFLRWEMPAFYTNKVVFQLGIVYY